MDQSKRLLAIALAMVMALSPLVIMYDDADASQTVTVSTGVVVQAVNCPDFDLRDDEGNIWATVSLDSDIEVGTTMNGFSVTPKVQLMQQVWESGTGQDDCDRLEMKYSEYYNNSMSAMTTYRAVYLNGFSAGDTASFETFDYEAFGDGGLIQKKTNKITYTFELVNSRGDSVFSFRNVVFMIDMFSGSTYEYTTEVRYDINGGTGGPSSPTVVTNTYSENKDSVPVALSTVSDMAKEGYRFKGWATDVSSSVVYAPGETYQALAGAVTTLIAVWEQASANITIMDGDMVLGTFTVETGKVPSMPQDPTKEGYIFLGWYTDSSLQTKWNASEEITSDITLYAGWKEELAFNTEPKASISVIKFSASEYRFDARSSENYESSAMSTKWSVVCDGKEVYTFSGPVMDYTFMDYGSYQVILTIENSDGVSDMCMTGIDILAPEKGPTSTPAALFLLIMGVLILLLLARVML